jgi:hypothetical protein
MLDRAAGVRQLLCCETSSQGLTCPEAGLGLLVHLPNDWIVNGEHAEAVWVLIQQGLGQLALLCHDLCHAAVIRILLQSFRP